MLKRRQVYYYDTETCTYQPEKLTSIFFLRKVFFYVLFGLVAALGGKYYFDHYLVQLKSAELNVENEQLLARLNVVNGKMDQFESNLATIYEKENALYLPIVGEAAIPQSRWMAGTGGSVIFDKSLNNAARKTSLRLTNMRDRLTLIDNSLDHIVSRAGKIDESLANMPSILPVSGSLMSGFGYRNHPVSGQVKFHEGLDFACPAGTPIYASGNGVIELAESGENGYGICININHNNGYMTKYAHLSQMVARNGQAVKRGQLIAYSGNTGLSSGPHLHYEVSFNGIKTDPIDFIYMDLPPQEYARLNIDKSTATKEKVKEKLVVPAMD
jgi:murein DD-endopeptidase MepM/ murein hydrolase activator NlpD